MEEKIISFETAKLAKEKGLNIGCEMVYSDMDSGMTAFNVVFGSGKQINEHIDAPTQSLLQKWLRDNHNIDITIITDWKKGKRVYTCGYSYPNSKNQIDISFSRPNRGVYKDVTFIKFKTYEQALEKGLQEALSQINP